MSLKRPILYRLLGPVIHRGLAGVGLVALSPVMLVVAWRVRRELGTPVLFRQTRAGLHGRPFTLLKFRTMRQVRPGEAELGSDALRLTAFGRRLRSSSLDELPSLVNVLRGDMNMVGPRPLLTSYLGRYSSQQARRHDVPPGITGLAQVSGRNALSWDDKLALDVRYVDIRSPGVDAAILVRTLGAVARASGVRSPGHVTAPEFLGSASAGDVA